MVCVSVCVSVNISKLQYLRNQWANRNKILSEPSLGWGKGCIRFWARSDRNSVVMATDSSHRVIMGKIVVNSLAPSFLSDLLHTCT